MHALVRNTELPRQLSLRNASSVSGADEGIALLDAQGIVRLRGVVVHDFERGTGQTLAIL